MHQLNTSARKQQPKGQFRSHTERYQNDLGYRTQMINQGVPEWLVFKPTGRAFRLDGEEGDQWRD